MPGIVTEKALHATVAAALSVDRSWIGLELSATATILSIIDISASHASGLRSLDRSSPIANIAWPTLCCSIEAICEPIRAAPEAIKYPEQTPLSFILASDEALSGLGVSESDEVVLVSQPAKVASTAKTSTVLITIFSLTCDIFYS